MGESLTVKTLDIGPVATDWWRENDARLLPGEEGAYTVFAVAFWDGCAFVDYTQGNAFERVSELAFGPVEVWRDDFVASHAVEMAYIVRCVASDLTRGDAVEVATRLVVAAPRGMELRGKGVLEHPQCFLGEHAPEPVTMSFGEWVKTREMAGKGTDLSTNVP